MSKHLVVIFAYHFPPENAIGGTRPYRFAKYLSRMGYTCRVFTAADQTGREDSSAEYVPDPFLTQSRRSPRWQVERLIRQFLLPGELGTLWSRAAARAARAHIRANHAGPVTIFSTFPPLGCHFAAWQLARGTNYRWIADFRDPMRNEQLQDLVSPFQNRVNRWLEDVFVRRADAVITNTDSATIRLQETYPSLGDKLHLIWNGFDPENRIQPLPIPPRNYKLLTHVGALYGGRKATPILKSIERLIATGRLPIGNVRVRLVGAAQTDCLPDPEFTQRAERQGWLSLETAHIPQPEALHLARTSDGLLLLQPQSDTQVPAKLFEYLQIGRPILAFIQPNSPVERLLERSGVPYRSVYPGSTSDVVDNTVAEFFALPSAATRTNSRFDETFSVENQTQALDNIIRALHERTACATRPLSKVSVGAKSAAVKRIQESQKAAIDLIDRASTWRKPIDPYHND